MKRRTGPQSARLLPSMTSVAEPPAVGNGTRATGIRHHAANRHRRHHQLVQTGLHHCRARLQRGSSGLQRRYARLQRGSAGLQRRYARLQRGSAGLQRRYARLQRGSAGLQRRCAPVHLGYASTEPLQFTDDPTAEHAEAPLQLINPAQNPVILVGQEGKCRPENAEAGLHSAQVKKHITRRDAERTVSPEQPWTAPGQHPGTASHGQPRDSIPGTAMDNRDSIPGTGSHARRSIHEPRTLKNPASSQDGPGPGAAFPRKLVRATQAQGNPRC